MLVQLNYLTCFFVDFDYTKYIFQELFSDEEYIMQVSAYWRTLNDMTVVAPSLGSMAYFD